MTALTLIDLQVDLRDVAIRRGEPRAGGEVFFLEGRSLLLARQSIEAAAAAAGYNVQRTPQTSSLLRNQQRINLVQTGASRMTITVDDPHRLPYAVAVGGTIRLGRFEFDLGAVQTVPRRELHVPDSREWRAEWEVRGKSASELSSSIVDLLRSSGLQSVGTMAPRDARTGATWHSEGYSAKTLVKARVKQQSEDVLLELTVIDGAEDEV